MRVWIDQDLCTGDGICEEICPDIFYCHDDGLYYVKAVSSKKPDLGPDGEPRLKMGEGLADVPQSLEDATIDAAEACPGECIMLEMD